MYCIEIYKVEETKKASFYYYNENKTLLKTISYDVNLSDTSSENTLSNLTKKYPAYISATYYSDESFTEDKKLDESYEVTDNATCHVVTTYNEKFPFPTNSDTYFALSTSGYYLGITNGTSMTYDNRNNYALRLQGNWYDKYKIVNYKGNVLDASNEYNITWKSSSESTYKWTIDDNGKIKNTENNNYLSIGKNCLLTPESYSDETSNAATASILSGLTAEYVGAYDKSQTGTVTFDDLVKGNNTLDFTNGTYYFIETADDANTVLSSSEATTIFGSAATSANLATNASKGFNELWQYQGGKFVHANSGLQLTPFALYNTGNTWAKTATGTAQAYKLNNGTTDLTVDANDTWKFRLAKSVTINLTEKDGTSYATTCAPVALTLPEEDTATTLYIEKSHKENTLSFEAATAVAANTGIYIENASGETSATLLFAESGTTPAAEDQILYGTNVTLDISSDDHALYRTLGFNSASKIGFFKPASSIAQIPANRAFLHFTTAPTSAFYIDFDATTTGIDTLLPAAETELDKNAPVYDLSGRRIQGTLRTGIYLQNGRKFMVK